MDVPSTPHDTAAHIHLRGALPRSPGGSESRRPNPAFPKPACQTRPPPYRCTYPTRTYASREPGASIRSRLATSGGSKASAEAESIADGGLFSPPAAVFSRSSVSSTSTMANLGEFTMDNIDGKATKMSTYKGKVCLVVNVASK